MRRRPYPSRSPVNPSSHNHFAERLIWRAEIKGIRSTKITIIPIIPTPRLKMLLTDSSCYFAEMQASESPSHEKQDNRIKDQTEPAHAAIVLPTANPYDRRERSAAGSDGKYDHIGPSRVSLRRFSQDFLDNDADQRHYN